MNIFSKALAQAQKNLDIIGAQYRIIDADGQVITNIQEEVKLKRRPRVLTVAPGTYSAIYKPVIDSMLSGDLHSIDVGDVNAEFFRAAMCSYASKLGKSISTEVKGKQVWVMVN